MPVTRHPPCPLTPNDSQGQQRASSSRDQTRCRLRVRRGQGMRSVCQACHRLMTCLLATSSSLSSAAVHPCRAPDSVPLHPPLAPLYLLCIQPAVSAPVRGMMGSKSLRIAPLATRYIDTRLAQPANPPALGPGRREASKMPPPNDISRVPPARLSTLHPPVPVVVWRKTTPSIPSEAPDRNIRSHTKHHNTNICKYP